MILIRLNKGQVLIQIRFQVKAKGHEVWVRHVHVDGGREKLLAEAVIDDAADTI